MKVTGVASRRAANSDGGVTRGASSVGGSRRMTAAGTMGASVSGACAAICDWPAGGAAAGRAASAGGISAFAAGAMGLAASMGLLMKTVGALEPTVQCGVDPDGGWAAVVAGFLLATVCGPTTIPGGLAPVSFTPALAAGDGDAAGKFAVRRLECGCLLVGGAGAAEGGAGAGEGAAAGASALAAAG